MKFPVFHQIADICPALHPFCFLQDIQDHLPGLVFIGASIPLQIHWSQGVQRLSEFIEHLSGTIRIEGIFLPGLPTGGQQKQDENQDQAIHYPQHRNSSDKGKIKVLTAQPRRRQNHREPFQNMPSRPWRSIGRLFQGLTRDSALFESDLADIAEGRGRAE